MSFLMKNFASLTRTAASPNFTNAFRNLSITSQLSVRQNLNYKPPKIIAKPITPILPQRSPSEDQKGCSNVISQVNKVIAEKTEGRLFAVIHLCGKQFKVTAGDIILVEGYWPPTIGDQIRLEKVLLVGGNDFTLIGRPIVDKNLVDVQATIVEKTLTHTKTHFKKKRRKQYMRINFQRSPNTMIRINSIDIIGQLDQTPLEPEDPTKIY
uniref:Large ribosomal subunit protein bL21m n=1 Tax=Megaselia scalaris TaxID=36166 RepID=T1GHT3_MEGSC